MISVPWPFETWQEAQQYEAWRIFREHREWCDGGDECELLHSLNGARRTVAEGRRQLLGTINSVGLCAWKRREG